jgi:hypothetical protein
VIVYVNVFVCSKTCERPEYVRAASILARDEIVLAKVDIIESPKLSKRYFIGGLPTYALFR